MKLINKYIDERGEIVGFLVEDGITYSIPSKLLYAELIIKQMVDSGYVYVDHDFTHITYNGESITELPAILADNNVTMELLMNGRNSKYEILDDAEASKFYTFSSNVDVPVFEFTTMKEYLINTREELESYIKEREAKAGLDVTTPVLPMNMLVNPDIWFTPEEILAGDPLYARAIRLRQFYSFQQYQKTCEIFAESNLMDKGDTSARSFLKAWYCFGPDLVKGNVTQSRSAYDVDGEFSNHDRLPSELKDSNPDNCYSSNSQNRIFRPGVFDSKTGEIVSPSGKRYSTTGIVSFDIGERRPIYLSQTFYSQLRMDSSLERIKPLLMVGYTDCSDRVYFTIQDGVYNVEFKADTDRVRISCGQQAVQFDAAMSITTLFTDLSHNITEVDTFERYNEVVISEYFTIAQSRDLAIDPIYRSNADYLKLMGMNPISIVKKYIAKFQDDDGMYTDLNPAWRGEDHLSYAIQMYVQPIPDYIRAAFDLPEEVETKTQFLEYADPSVYALKLQLSHDLSNEGDVAMSYVPATLKGPEALNYIRNLQKNGVSHEPLNYYNHISFVDSILTGSEMYGALLEGTSDDSRVKIKESSDALRAAVFAVKPDADLESFVDTIIDISSYINMSRIYKKRTAAAVGCIRDMAEDASARYSDDVYAFTYITKIFRELSNKPVEEQRPYMLELFAFCKDNKTDKLLRSGFRELVEGAMENVNVVPDYLSYDKAFETYGNTVATKEQLSKKFAGMASAELLFRCFLGVHLGKIPTTQDYVRRITLPSGGEVECTVPAKLLNYLLQIDPEAHRKYVTLYDYTEFEIALYENGNPSQFVCINADVDPWSVNPKPGFTIKSYPLMINYFDPEVIATNLGKQVALQCQEDKVKVVKNLNLKKDASPLINQDYTATDIAVKVANSYSDLDSLLVLGGFESTQAYIKRWNLLRDEAKSRGEVLLSMPLKQDILYPEFGRTLGYSVDEEPTYTTDSTRARFFLEDRTVLTVKNSGTSNAITMQTTGYAHPITLQDINLVGLKQLCRVLTKQAPAINLVTNTVTTDGKLITEQFMQEYGVKVSDHVYMAKGLNGIFVLEV